MMPKIGRPKVVNPKSINFTVRLTETLNEELEKFCKKHNLSKSEVVRDGIKKVIKKQE